MAETIPDAFSSSVLFFHICMILCVHWWFAKRRQSLPREQRRRLAHTRLILVRDNHLRNRRSRGRSQFPWFLILPSNVLRRPLLQSRSQLRRRKLLTLRSSRCSRLRGLLNGPMLSLLLSSARRCARPRRSLVRAEMLPHLRLPEQRRRQLGRLLPHA